MVQLAAALVNQSEIVVRGSISRIECCRLEVLLERRPSSMAAHDVAEITAQQHEKKEQKKWRASDSRKQVERDRRDKLHRKIRDERYTKSAHRRHPERVFHSQDYPDAEQSSLEHREEVVRQENRIFKLFGEWTGLSKLGRRTRSLISDQKHGDRLSLDARVMQKRRD